VLGTLDGPGTGPNSGPGNRTDIGPTARGDGRGSTQADRSARERSDPGRAGAKTGRHHNQPGETFGLTSTPQVVHAGIALRAEWLLHLAYAGRWRALPATDPRPAREIPHHQQRLTKASPAPRMHQLQLRCLITMNHVPRRHGIHRPGNCLCPSVYLQQSRHSGRSGWAAGCASSPARQARGRRSSAIVEDLPVNGDGAGNIVHVAFG